MDVLCVISLVKLISFQDNLQKFVPSIGGSLGDEMINVGGHFVSKQAGQLQYGGIHIGGGAPVPPPKPGSKGVGAVGAGGVGGGDHGKGGLVEGASELSSQKGWYEFFLLFIILMSGNLLLPPRKKKISILF